MTGKPFELRFITLKRIPCARCGTNPFHDVGGIAIRGPLQGLTFVECIRCHEILVGEGVQEGRAPAKRYVPQPCVAHGWCYHDASDGRCVICVPYAYEPWELRLAANADKPATAAPIGNDDGGVVIELRPTGSAK